MARLVTPPRRSRHDGSGRLLGDRRVVVGLLGVALVVASAAGAAAQHDCRTDAHKIANMRDEERIRHQNAMTMLKTKKDTYQTQEQMAHNNCPRGDNECHRKVKESFAKAYTEVKNEELVENNKHREIERNLGQLKRDCAIEERMERRKRQR
jgi:hypothetical protein